MCGGGLKGPKSSNGIQLSRFIQSYGIFSDFVVPMVPAWYLLSPHHPHHPHTIPIAPRRSPCGPHCPHPCCPRHSCCPHIIPTSSPSSPHCLEGPQIIPNPPGSHLTHPTPLGVGPQITKNAIRFELIKIF